MEKRRNCFLGAISPLFHNISIYSLTKSPITYIFVKCGCSNYCFLNSANLICRGTDISKYFRESLGIRDNESRLYIFIVEKNDTGLFDISEKSCFAWYVPQKACIMNSYKNKKKFQKKPHSRNISCKWQEEEEWTKYGNSTNVTCQRKARLKSFLFSNEITTVEPR